MFHDYNGRDTLKVYPGFKSSPVPVYSNKNKETLPKPIFKTEIGKRILKRKPVLKASSRSQNAIQSLTADTNDSSKNK